MAPNVCNINIDGRCGVPVYTGVDVGQTHTCAVVSDGTLNCWGANDKGQLWQPNSTPYRVPYLVLDPEDESAKPRKLESVREVIAGWRHTCVLLWTGQVECWGFNDDGELGCAPQTGTTSVQHCSPYPPGSPVSEIVAGGYHNCARLTDGTVQCWGLNNFGQLGNGTNTGSPSPVTVRYLPHASRIAGGIWHNCALIDDGTVECWGHDEGGKLGDGSTNDSVVPKVVVGISGRTDADRAIAIAAGSTHSCVLLSNGSIECFGQNTQGQLGDGNSGDGAAFADSAVPIATQFSSPAAGVVAAVNYTCALINPNLVQCVGDGRRGQLGNGVFAASLTPVAVQLPSGAAVKYLAAKYDQTCALTNDGNLWCWGIGDAGQLGVAGFVDSNVPVKTYPPATQ